MLESILTHFEEIKARGLSIDITRGKPDSYQLDLSNELLKMDIEPIDGDIDLRNYGEPFGISDARQLGADVLCAPKENIITGEQSSLLLSYQMILAKYLFDNPTAWKDLDSPKFICPVPGFDRHFKMFEDFGIEMITVPLIEEGIDIQKFEEALNSNKNVMGVICVPRHSNPSGEVYSDKNIINIFQVGRAYSDNFLFLFDNAYLVHDFMPTREQTPVWKLAEDTTTIKQVVVVTSFSKVTFGGGGLSFMAASDANLELIKRIRGSMVICPDKINQKRHTQFFSGLGDIKNHMIKHAELIRPKFEIVYKALRRLDKDFGNFSQPTGGYFVTFISKKPTASRIVQLCKEAGVLLTPAGATHPYGKDPNNSTLRIAPTFINKQELEVAMDVFITAVQIAHLET
ncbi:aspartate aminotransferase [Gammaproteobacteria bacterium]|nr:aspartate aminotransferase [Gammaproteobacteria bacterium]MDC0402177.1 aspartate aminotransferase [Gammaproteobacteria bacterium]MDC1074973.1 aspartate aminotransferase [Gammaproteobacteria bacterium]